LARFRLNLAEIAGKYVDVPYKLGGKDLSGMDCLMFINSIGRELGVNIPDEFKGVSEDNYTKLWSESPNQAKLSFVSYILSLGKKIDIPFLFPPDLVLFRDGDDVLGVGVYAGKGLILSSFVGDRIGLVQRGNYPIEVVVRWVAADKEE
jgi:cell wall-associated NlpC family hydrolase